MKRNLTIVIEWASRLMAVAALFATARPGTLSAADDSATSAAGTKLTAADHDVVAGASVEVDVDNEDEPPPRSE